MQRTRISTVDSPASSLAFHCVTWGLWRRYPPCTCAAQRGASTRFCLRKRGRWSVSSSPSLTCFVHTLPSSRSKSRSGELASPVDDGSLSSQCSVYHNTCGVVAIFVAAEREKGGRKAPLYEPRSHSQRGREHTGCRNRRTGGRRTGRERALPAGFLVRARRWSIEDLRHLSGSVKKPGSTLKSPVSRPEMVRGEVGGEGRVDWLRVVGLFGSLGPDRSGAATSVAGRRRGEGRGGAPNREEEEARGALLLPTSAMVRLP